MTWRTVSSRVRRSGILGAVCLAGCAALALSGCAASTQNEPQTASPEVPSREGFSDTAVLHPDTGVVDLPLNSYEVDDPEYNALSLHARDATTNRCLTEHHLAPVTNSPGWKPEPRPFAWYPMIWSKQLAQKYGFDTPDPPSSADPSAGESQEKIKQRASCEQRGRDALDERRGAAPLPRTYSELSERARSAADGDGEGRAALADIAQCLKGKHVQVDPETGLHGRATDIMPPAQQIPIATAEAACATSTGGAQRYFDVLAQYQAALITQNRDALEQGVQEQQSAKDQLREFIESEERKK